MSELSVGPPWYGQQPNGIARQLDFVKYLLENKFKAINTLPNKAEYIITRERVF